MRRVDDDFLDVDKRPIEDKSCGGPDEANKPSIEWNFGECVSIPLLLELDHELEREQKKPLTKHSSW